MQSTHFWPPGRCATTTRTIRTPVVDSALATKYTPGAALVVSHVRKGDSSPPGVDCPTTALPPTSSHDATDDALPGIAGVYDLSSIAPCVALWRDSTSVSPAVTTMSWLPVVTTPFSVRVKDVTVLAPTSADSTL